MRSARASWTATATATSRGPSRTCSVSISTAIDGERAEDNGHYVGHDEPAIQFLSNKPGSGNAMSYDVTLPREPAARPNGSYKGPVWTFQLSIAPWFGLVMCDTQSWPEGGRPVTRDSDTNIQVPPRPGPRRRRVHGAPAVPARLRPRPFLHKISCDRTTGARP